MNSNCVRRLEITVAAITPKTRWIFVTIELASGRRGVGEATAPGHEAAVMEAFERIAPPLRGSNHLSLCPLLATLSPADLAEAAVVSSLDQAAWDLVAQERCEPLAAALVADAQRPGQSRRVGLYANVNRRTLDRSPAGFAASARAAVAAGHTAIKIAPFDEATPVARRDGDLGRAIGPGIERIRAVRASIGRDVRLMVDCHWRLDMETTRRLVEVAAELDLYWIECPLPEQPEALEGLRALRSCANARGIKLAGCELMTRREGFAPFLSAGAYDVIMPDVKYVGGLKELLALAADARQAHVELSPHNPTGPVCHAVSLHVCAAIGGTDLLEMQFDESSLFEQLQAPRLPPIDRDAALIPDLPGIGLSLEGTVLTRTTERHWACE